MRILYLDDEEGNVAEYRKALREKDHTVKATTRISDAVNLLNESFTQNQPYDLVLIDLMLAGQKIPFELKALYSKLSKQSHNEGQALGQWLWEKEGARQQANRPVHCYFSNVTAIYAEHTEAHKQEFSSIATAHEQFLLNKTKIKPSELKGKLDDVIAAWDKLRLK